MDKETCRSALKSFGARHFLVSEPIEGELARIVNNCVFWLDAADFSCLKLTESALKVRLAQVDN